MGIYSKNSHIETDTIHVEAAAGYEGNVGVSTILVENMVNDHALFEALITNDFKEVALGESATDEDILSLQEAATGGFVSKIIEWLKGVWAKVKGLFESFIKKIQQVISVDNKKYVEKTKQEVIAKDLSKMTYKWRKQLRPIDKVEAFNPDAMPNPLGNFDSLMKMSAEDLSKEQNTKGSEEFKVKVANDMDLGIKISEIGELRKELMNSFFDDDTSEEEGLSSAQVNELIDTLTNGKKEIKAIKKFNDKINKFFNDTIKDLGKLQAKVSKLVPKGGKVEIDGQEKNYDKDEASKAAKAIATINTGVQSGQSVMNTVISVSMEIVKFNIRQSRQIWNKAVMFNPKSVKENALLVEAAGDLADYEMELAWGPDYN